MKPSVAPPKFGPLTQGTIFNSAVAEDYADCETHGIVLTARCDVEQDKARTYNYVPVVLLRDWRHRDGRILLGERLMSDTIGKLRDALIAGGYSTSILETEHPRSVLQTLFPAANTTKMAKARAEFDALCSRHELATQALSSDPAAGVCDALAAAAPKLRTRLVQELTSHRLAGYYFLQQIDPQGDDIGYVALLREVQLIPRKLAQAIGTGLDADTFARMCGEDPTLKERLRIGPKDLAMPVGILQSPNAEHFMQSFSLLFGRIGIADIDKSYIEKLWERQSDTEGGI
jgi:hypothetical protein